MSSALTKKRSIGSKDAKPLLAVRTVSKAYGAITAVNEVSFDVLAGELFGLLGPNGAGKTTLLAILSGLLAADKGTVTIDGIGVQPDQCDVRRHIGLAPQDIAFSPELTAAENLRFFGRLFGLGGAELEARIGDTLSTMGLSSRQHDRVGGFSGGMKRRLNLSAAILHKPKILFLDEPTAGVDPRSRNHIFQEIRQLNSTGMTVIYTSHYMEEVQALCPRVGIIDAGRLIRCESITELLKLESTVVRFSSHGMGPSLVAALRELPGVTDVHDDNATLEIRTQSTSATLPALLGHLESVGLATDSMEIEPPTLERIFLQLTGHKLRD